MGTRHINERGSHTTVIEQAFSFLKILKKEEVLISPGIIEVIKSSKSKTAKFKKINNELFELVITSGSSKQTFKVFSRNQSYFLKKIKDHKKLLDWNIGYIDTSEVQK